MIDFEAVLNCAVEKGGRELHLTAGKPPIIRSDKGLEELVEFSTIHVKDIAELKDSLLDAEAEEILEEEGMVEVIYENCRGQRVPCSVFKTVGTFGIITHLETLNKKGGTRGKCWK